jgi:hypothetical protein
MLTRRVTRWRWAVILIIMAVVSNIKYNEGGNDRDEDDNVVAVLKRQLPISKIK